MGVNWRAADERPEEPCGFFLVALRPRGWREPPGMNQVDSRYWTELHGVVIGWYSEDSDPDRWWTHSYRGERAYQIGDRLIAWAERPAPPEAEG